MNKEEVIDFSKILLDIATISFTIGNTRFFTEPKDMEKVDTVYNVKSYSLFKEIDGLFHEVAEASTREELVLLANKGLENV